MKKIQFNYNIGDKILVKYQSNDGILEKEGFFIPRPDYYDDSTFVFKMKSGYNIGISKKKILEIKILEENKKKEERIIKKVNNKNLKYKKKIAIIGLGGTIASKVDYKTGGVIANLRNEDLFELYPDLKKYNVDIDIAMNEMSENFNNDTYIQIAKIVKAKIEQGYEGLILMHGTDTLHYTASILSFMLKNLKIPVILTGSQRSIDRGSSDAFLHVDLCCKALNFIDFGKVMIGFHENDSDDSIYLLNATKTRKMHSSKRAAFKPINDLPILRVTKEDVELLDENKYEIIKDIVYRKNSDNINNRNSLNKFEIDTKLSNKVMILYFFPGINPDIIDYMYNIGYRVFIIMGTGLGNIEVPHLLERIKEYSKKYTNENEKPFFFMATQTIYGRTNEFVYSTLRQASKYIFYLKDMIPETIFCKSVVMYEKENFIENMKKNIADEIDDKS